MDFNYSEEQEAVRELAGRIFTERATHDRLKEIERQAAAEGSLRPRAVGGTGRGRTAGHSPRRRRRRSRPRLRRRLPGDRSGRSVRRLMCPVVETMIYGAAPIAAFRHRRAEGDLVARREQRRHHPHCRPGRVGRRGHPSRRHHPGHDRHGAGRRITGSLTAPRPACRRHWWPRPSSCRPPSLAPTAAQRGCGVFIVDAADSGRDLRPARAPPPAGPRPSSSWTGSPLGPTVSIGGAGADGAAIVTFITELATTALCVQEAGACAAALELTAEYTKTREQFEKPIATFQAVGQRAADAYVDTEAIRLTAWQAASRLVEWPAGRGRSGGGQVLGGRRWPAGRARGRAPPRRRRR